jgi:glyoxylase-like metal-dependent hydrolase (beta-lactamase superfamily II)
MSLAQFAAKTAQCTIHTYASKEEAFWVNSFILETENGLILVDTQFLVTPTNELHQKIEALRKPLLGVIITHPHPDHFGGTSIVLEGKNIPVYATQATLDVIKATEAGKREFWTPIYKQEYPTSTRLPDKIVKPGEKLVIDGLEIVIDDLGAGESADITVIHLPQTGQLIVSDLVYNRAHPWLAEGRSQAWLDQLALVKKRYSDVGQVFAGHGPDGSLKMLDEQAEYITYFREQVFAERKNGTVTDAAKARITASIKSRYAGFAMESLIAFNIDGVAKETI